MVWTLADINGWAVLEFSPGCNSGSFLVEHTVLEPVSKDTYNLAFNLNIKGDFSYENICRVYSSILFSHKL